MPPHTPESEALGRTQGSACLQPWETLMHTGDCCLREPPGEGGRLDQHPAVGAAPPVTPVPVCFSWSPR